MLRDNIPSLLGRLLAEVSWEGSGVKKYREGGRGYENVLTAETLQWLDVLPRSHFLGAVVNDLQGITGPAIAQLTEQIAQAELSLLPGDMYLKPSGSAHQTKICVQPDGILETADVYALIEAKRIRPSTFQSKQLAREYVLVTREARGRHPLLILMLGKEPPVQISGHGRMDPKAAILKDLPDVLAETDDHTWTLDELESRIDTTVCWTTWYRISEIVTRQEQSFSVSPPSAQETISRLVRAVVSSIDWHK